MRRSNGNGDAGSIVQQIELSAPAEVVWKALTDAKELVRWLPLEARVKPGKGGSMWLSWGEPVVEQSRIVAWEPNRLLRTREIRPFGAPFEPRQARGGGTRVLDFLLEPLKGKTLLHFEHSGFAGGSSGLADFKRNLAACWRFQLGALQHYVERHLGDSRTVSWARAVSNGRSFQQTWKRVAGPQGILRSGSLEGLRKGDRYSIRAANGDRFTGVVVDYERGKQFAGTVANMNDSLLRVVLDHCAGRPEAAVWLASYGAKHPAANLFEHRWTHLLQNVLS